MTENHNQLKCKVAQPSPQWSYLQDAPPPNTQGTLQKDCKNQRIREFIGRLCFLIMSEMHPESLTNLTAQYQGPEQG